MREAIPDLEARLKAIINQQPVTLFMKGNPEEPRCGFSRKVGGRVCFVLCVCVCVCVCEGGEGEGGGLFHFQGSSAELCQGTALYTALCFFAWLCVECVCVTCSHVCVYVCVRGVWLHYLLMCAYHAVCVFVCVCLG